MGINLLLLERQKMKPVFKALRQQTRLVPPGLYIRKEQRRLQNSLSEQGDELDRCQGVALEFQDCIYLPLICYFIEQSISIE